jgi:translation initiation factor IF-1
MPSSDLMEIEGIVTQVCPGATFKVTLVDDEGTLSSNTIFCTLSGQLRRNHIKIVLNDSVTVKVSPYDLSKGIISWRNK